MVTVIHLHPVMTSLMIQWQSLMVVTKLYILKSLKYLVWSFTEKICPTSAHTADHISNILGNSQICHLFSFMLLLHVFLNWGEMRDFKSQVL